MGITLNLTVSTPLSEEDEEILAGTAYWLMATARRNAPEEPEPDEAVADEAVACTSRSRTDPTLACAGRSGHAGRHRYRPQRFEGRLH